LTLARPLDSLQDAVLDGEKERSWPEGRAVRLDGINSLAVLLIWTLENGLPFQASGDRGILESVTNNPLGVAICRFVFGTGTHPAFLLHAGTSDLLAFLQLSACLTGSDNFSGRACLLLREISCPLGMQDGASNTDS